MLTSHQIRQGFLDFFREKQHTIVPSSSLMPDSPNLLFTNAGMNQFVPIFLGEKKADVSKWGGAIPGSDTRAADTQKCIRAGGKHNDLDDVGLDTYHHTFFEMLGNWSFGDYFKKEAIEWAWELIVERWKFPPQRVYATIYQPGPGDPAERDQEAWDFWAEKFRSKGLDPAIHIVNGNKKDNFWMMGETGPCGPCSELHIDLTPYGDTRGLLVNQGTAECIEIWNLVFIQFNANPDGTFTPLPAQHVDTGMGFERVASIIQGTHGFTNFGNARISNYETDIFRPIFDDLEKFSGKVYQSTLPAAQKKPEAGGGSPAVSEFDQKAGDFLENAGDFLQKASGFPPSAGDFPSSAASNPEKAGSFPPSAGGFPQKAGDFPASASGIQPPAADLPSKAGDFQPPAASGEDQIAIDVAFRVIADHIRTLSFAIADHIRCLSFGIADGILPSNEGRGYVLRRILRRAVRYGRTLGFREPFFYKLVAVLAREMGDVFPNLRERQRHVEEVLKREEEAFNKTLDKGLTVFSEVSRYVEAKQSSINYARSTDGKEGKALVGKLLQAQQNLLDYVEGWIWEKVASPAELSYRDLLAALPKSAWESVKDGQIPNQTEVAELRELAASLEPSSGQVPGAAAFMLYDTYGFPLDLTELMARERGLTVDVAGFETEMEKQRARARAAQKKEIITVSDDNLQVEATKFLGYDFLETEAVVEAVLPGEKAGEFNVILDRTACYAEMGGQVGDTGRVHVPGPDWSEVGQLTILNTVKKGNVFLHRTALAEGRAPEPGEAIRVAVDITRRGAIQRHHTVTHLLHWALHEVVSHEATQKGSYVGPEKLTFDFNHQPLTPQQVRDVERLVNEKIIENGAVSWTEVPYADVRGRGDIMQFFGDKYGETVRVVQIGGHAQKLDGYSMELCAGTHTRATGEIGLFRIASEAAIAAGVRRIEAQAGLNAYDLATSDTARLHALATKLGTPLPELEKRIESLLAQQKELERSLKAASQREAAGRAKDLLASATTINGIPAIVANLGAADGDTLQTVADALKSHGFTGVVVLGGSANGAVALVASVSGDFTAKVQAGKIISAIAPLVGGKGGGKPDNARGGGKDPSQLDAALAHARTLLG